jgi:hypothetical protein
MVALIALAAFGIIGFLLAAAVICESKTAGRTAAEHYKHSPAGKSA